MMIKKTNQQVSTKLDGEVVLLELLSGKYFTLNEVGAFLWAHLDEPKSQEDLVRALVCEYEVDASTAESDVALLVSALASAGFVVQDSTA